MKYFFRILFAAVAAIATLPVHAAELQLDKITLPDGFQIAVFADNVPNARAMVYGDNGTLFVGTRREGKVYAVTDADGDMKADNVRVVAEGLDMPAGVDFRDGALYASSIDRIIRLDNIESRLDNPPEPVVVSDAFPSNEWHGWKFIRFGPDGLLYVPVGAPCNICEPDPDKYANIMRMKPDGTNLEVFARGIRNTVGFDWHPVTGVMWFSDNGRDWMGDNLPPGELNSAPAKGLHFGYPYMHGRDVKDPEYGDKMPDGLRVREPEVEMKAHVAPLGVRFYTGTQFPKEYRNRLFIAQHGSWNRSTPIGYRVMMATIENGAVTDFRPFAEGWLIGGKDWGRPVDVENAPDGSILVSDDSAGVIYRIYYTGE